MEKEPDSKKKAAVLILGAGRVCQPAAEMLSSFGRHKTLLEEDFEDQIDVDVIVGSLYLKDAEQVYLDQNICFYISFTMEVELVFSNLSSIWYYIGADCWGNSKCNWNSAWCDG